MRLQYWQQYRKLHPNVDMRNVHHIEQVKAKAEQITQETARQANKQQSPKILVHISRQVENTATHNAPDYTPTLHVVRAGETYESIAQYYRKYPKYARLTAALLKSYNSDVYFKEGAQVYLIP